MRTTLTLSATAILFILFSCRRDAIDAPKPQSIPTLKRTVVKDSTGKITRTTNYNEWEKIVTDSAFSNGALWVWIANEYNSKGKRTKSTTWAPVFTPTGYHWMDIDEYKDDTIPVLFRHYLHGSQTLLTKHIYNASKQLVIDSNFHTAIGASASTPYTRAYSYDAQGRIQTNTRLDDKNDSVTFISYQYSLNHVEEFTKTFTPYGNFSSLIVVDYTSSGKILSQKTYSPLNQLSSQADYTYDATGNVVKMTNLSGNTWEYHYTYNAITGKPDQMETYSQNKLISTTFYYYE